MSATLNGLSLFYIVLLKYAKIMLYCLIILF